MIGEQTQRKDDESMSSDVYGQVVSLEKTKTGGCGQFDKYLSTFTCLLAVESLNEYLFNVHIHMSSGGYTDRWLA